MAAWDISTATYASKSLDISSQVTGASGLFVDSGGTRVFVVCDSSDEIYRYTLSTAKDISSGSYASDSYDTSGRELIPRGLFIRPDGTELFYCGNDGYVEHPDMSSAWSLTTASDSGNKYIGSNMFGVTFKPDGTKMYVTKYNYIYQYDLTTAWNTSPVKTKEFEIGSYSSDVRFSSDGTKMYTLNFSGTITQWTLSTAWEVDSASDSGKSFLATSQDTVPRGFNLSDNGETLWVLGRTNKYIYQYTLVTPAGWTGTFNKIASTDIAKINGVAVADIAKVNGVE